MAQDEFLEEVKEELRREQILKIWDDYGNIIIGIGLALIVVVAGYIGYEKYQQKHLEDQSILYESYLADPGNKSLEDKVLKDGSQGVQILTLLQQAVKESSNEIERAKILQKMADTKDLPAFYQDYARYNTLAAKFNATNPKTMVEELKAFLETKSAFLPLAKELLAFAYYKLGLKDQARVLFVENTSDTAAPHGVRMRANAMVRYLAN